MSKLLFEFVDRDECHQKLAEIINTHPLAECRVDPTSAKPHQVWSEPDERANKQYVAPPREPEKEPEFTVEELRKLKALLGREI